MQRHGPSSLTIHDTIAPGAVKTMETVPSNVSVPTDITPILIKSASAVVFFQDANRERYYLPTAFTATYLPHTKQTTCMLSVNVQEHEDEPLLGRKPNIAVYLNIQHDHVSSVKRMLVRTPMAVKRHIADPECFQFKLSKPPDLMVPHLPVDTRIEDSEHVLQKIHLLAQQRTFDVYTSRGPFFAKGGIRLYTKRCSSDLEPAEDFRIIEIQQSNEFVKIHVFDSGLPPLQPPPMQAPVPQHESRKPDWEHPSPENPRKRRYVSQQEPRKPESEYPSPENPRKRRHDNYAEFFKLITKPQRLFLDSIALRYVAELKALEPTLAQLDEEGKKLKREYEDLWVHFLLLQDRSEELEKFLRNRRNRIGDAVVMVATNLLDENYTLEKQAYDKMKVISDARDSNMAAKLREEKSCDASLLEFLGGKGNDFTDNPVFYDSYHAHLEESKRYILNRVKELSDVLRMPS